MKLFLRLKIKIIFIQKTGRVPVFPRVCVLLNVDLKEQKINYTNTDKLLVLRGATTTP